MTVFCTIGRPLEVKIEPRSKNHQERLLSALQQFAHSDPTFGFNVDAESGEVILQGQSELHLDLKIDRLLRDHCVEVNVGPLQVAYRETILRSANCEYTHKTPKFTRVRLCVSPRDRGTGNSFEHDFEDAPVVAEFLRAVENSVHSVLKNGLLIGFPIVDIAVTLLSGDFDSASADAATFELAARTAMKEACTVAHLVLLEPIMKAEIETPSQFLGSVLFDVLGRRGMIVWQEMRGEATVLTAYVPLATMFGHAISLNRITLGKGRANMIFDHYDFVPRNNNGGPDNFPPAVGMRA